MYIINGKGSIIRVIAGVFVLGSVLLGMFVHENFLYFTGLVGLMLFLSGTTGFCPMEMMLKLTPIKQRSAVDSNN
jgi:hypothetical protein